MTNIILQHWTGELDELVKLSSSNIEKYAKSIGADYKLIRGNAFNNKLKTPWAPVQKLHMLNEEFDKYDMVVMLDSDMFARSGMEDNIFEDESGIGIHQAAQTRLLKGIKRRKPTLGDPTAPWWGGGVYRLEKDIRKKLRVHIKSVPIDSFCGRGNYGDEGIMHRLATLARIEPQGTYFKDTRWCHCSYREGIEDAALIHIRKKIAQGGPLKPKMENYMGLVKRGIIDGDSDYIPHNNTTTNKNQ